MAQRETRNWSAVHTTNFAGGDGKLTVSGEVQTLNSSEVPALAEANPQGINDQILLVDLTVSSSGIGADVLGWATATLIKPGGPNDYASVMITSGDETVDVEVVVLHS
jgi:hypothetical protein